MAAGSHSAPRIEPPYGIIAHRLRKSLVVPFLGAGASLIGRGPQDVWNPAQPRFLPSGADLSRFLADESSFPEQDGRFDLAKVSSYYVDNSGRRALRERLRELLHREAYVYGPLHGFLASLPAPLVIVSTNYDNLLEQAFLAAGRAYDLVAYPADRKDVAGSVLWWPHGQLEPNVVAPNELDIDLAQTTVIYKMHGTIVPSSEEWDSFVITEEDYVEFLSRMTANVAIPSIFFRYFRERSFLFLGYGLGDWNLRVVLKNLSKHLSAPRGLIDDDQIASWAIQRSPSELERRLWARRNVNIFDVSLDAFVAGLQARRAF